MPEHTEVMEKIVALCRRRGFIFGSSEIYGGIGGFWDYGPLGCELKRNIKDAWWYDNVRNPPLGPNGREYQMVGVDCSIIMNSKVWEASGHVGGFNDPMVDDKDTKQRFRADQLFGVYVASVGDGDIDAAYAKLRDRIASDPDFLPVLTCVAGSGGEAEAEFARSLAKLAKPLGWTVAEQMTGRSHARYDIVLHDRSKSVLLGEVKPVSADKLKRFAGKVPSPFTQKSGALTEPRLFNLMFMTYIGAIQDEDSKAYLRPETAQGLPQRDQPPQLHLPFARVRADGD